MDTSSRSSLLSHADSWTAGALAIAVKPIGKSLTCGEVLRLFTEDERSPPSFAVETTRGFGLIDRVHCASILAQRFGRELYNAINGGDRRSAPLHPGRGGTIACPCPDTTS